MRHIFGWDLPAGCTMKDIEDACGEEEEDGPEAPGEPEGAVRPCPECKGEGHYMYQPVRGEAYDAVCWLCNGTGTSVD